MSEVIKSDVATEEHTPELTPGSLQEVVEKAKKIIADLDRLLVEFKKNKNITTNEKRVEINENLFKKLSEVVDILSSLQGKEDEGADEVIKNIFYTIGAVYVAVRDPEVLGVFMNLQKYAKERFAQAQISSENAIKRAQGVLSKTSDF